MVAGRHDALRAFFRWDHAKDISQHFADTVAAPVQIMPAIANGAGREKVLSDFLRADRHRGFDLATTTLWRLTIFPWTDRAATTVWTFHHSSLDGRSHAQVWQEVDAVYRALLAGKTPASPAMETLALNAAATTLLREAAQRHGVTLNSLVQGAWALPVHLFREHGSFIGESHPANFAITDHFAVGGWRHWAGCEPEVMWLEGKHALVLKQPQVKRTAEQLRAAMAKHFAEWHRRLACVFR